jgi:hypothetical protein
MQSFSASVQARIMAGVVLCFSVFAVGAAWGQSAATGGEDRHALSAQEVVARMLEKNRQRAAALEHYTTDRTYRIAYTGAGGDHAGELHVHAEYLGAERKKLTVTSQSGSPFLCNKILKKLVEDEAEESGEANRKMMLTPDNYDVAMLGEDVVEGVDFAPGASPRGAVKTWVLSVTPKKDNKFGYTGKVWISEDDFAIVRIVGEPAKAPSFLMDKAQFDSLYARRGQVWLPARNSSATHLRFGGDAKLSIDYGSYSQLAAVAVKPPVQTASNPGGMTQVRLRTQ